MSDPGDDVRGHYPGAAERDRLDSPLGQVEYARTVEVLRRRLPAPPAVIADIGGGPGRYALLLAVEGYTVRHRDLVPLHVEQLTADAEVSTVAVDSAVGDARALDLADASVDAVLLLGPLYHLTSQPDRVLALREARRIVKPGGYVFAAAISRWAPRLHGRVTDRLDTVPVELAERTGVLGPAEIGGFSGYTHRPHELADEIRQADLALVDLVSLEGIAFALADLDARMADPAAREVILDAARATERVPELLGLGPHLLATARRD